MTLYALDPNQDPEGLFTIEPMERGWSYLKDAVALWRLIDDQRAEALRAAMTHTHEDSDGNLLWSPERLRQVVALLSGLEDALEAAGIIDNEWLIPLDRVPELARQVESMDARPERPDVDLKFSLAEVMFRARAVRLFLTNAAEAGFDVTMD